MRPEKKIEFLYSAIASTEELIRFIDSKTTIVISIMGAFLLGCFSALEDIIHYSDKYSKVFWVLLTLFLLLILMCVFITKRIIRPTNNPSENIKLGNIEKPGISYYLAVNDYNGMIIKKNFWNSSSYKLAQNYESYFNSIEKASETDIIRSLSFEFLKVSYIKNVKNDRLNVLLSLLVYTTLLFIVTFIYFVQEKLNFEN